MTPQAFIDELGDAVSHHSLPVFARKCRTDPEYQPWARKLTHIIKVYTRRSEEVPASIYLADDPAVHLYV